MNRFIRYLWLSAALLPALVLAAPPPAAESADATVARARLAEVRSRIAAMTTRLSAQLKDCDAQASRLRDADLRITANRQRLESVHAEQAAAERRRGDLRVQEARNRTALDVQRDALASQVRAAYLMGRQEELKLLLNQRDPAAAGRLLAYYGYFVRERSARIDDIREQVARVQALVVQIDAQTARLQVLQADSAREMSQLQQARAERVAALAAVARQVNDGTQQLAQLKREEQAEESLVADLARVLQDFPVDTQLSFGALHGRLPWPVPGRLAHYYQEVRTSGTQSGLRSNGVLIETTRGAKVRAPYSGRVVYADWLQGLGLLLIIGHSGNYMTLYGHAEVLYKSVGDWVSPGDVIAAVSDSSGAAPQLYFEIRDGRRAVDPKDWLKAVP